MKRLLLITILFLFSITSFAQKIRFSDSTNKWHCYLLALQLEPPVIEPTDFVYTGTILFHNTWYKKMYNDGTNYCIGYIREDTIARKIYGIYLSTITPVENTIDSTEYLLYDYNLQVGDTLKRPYTVSHYVDAIDSVLINNIWHKTWHLVPTILDSVIAQGMQTDYYVIEGIGCIFYPFFPANPTYFESGYSLTCFSTDSATPPLSQTVGQYFNNATSCSLTFGLGINSVVLQNGKINLYPNPTTNSLTITSSQNISTLSISNLLGQTIYTKQYNSQQVEVDVSSFPPGIYFAKINGTEVQKFVKQ